jgi:urease accessory protein
MLDLIADQTVNQRSSGSAALAVQRGSAGGVRIGRLEQSGSARIFLPRVHHTHAAAEAVFLNTSGGLTDNDRLDLSMAVAAHVYLTATTQTAERAYRSLGPPARMTVMADVGAGARLDWLPQETILFEAAHLQRRTEIALASDATCLLAETVVLGRHAMGEAISRARLTDRRRVTRLGRPVWSETMMLDAEVLAAADHRAVLGGARALSVVALIARGAEDAAAPIRDVLNESGVEGAASGFDGRCLIRLMARDAWPLRRQLARVLGLLRPGPLPRVWQT